MNIALVYMGFGRTYGKEVGTKSNDKLMYKDHGTTRTMKGISNCLCESGRSCHALFVDVMLVVR